METHFNLKPGVLAAMLYLSALCSATLFAVLLVCIFVWGASEGVKRAAIRALMLMLAFTVVQTLLGWPYDLKSLLESGLSLIRIYPSGLSLLTAPFSILMEIVGLLKEVIFILSAFLALKGREIPLPFLK